ncbi:ribosome maturation factor RimM [Mesorhizobium sp. L-8-10]|uniref:ribosome maturation factor RimM n=1 Tax=unclassified Mesorhizobium TaxID=325217 RepID=UPI001927FE66|nr:MULTISPECIES: ribosome maturation factor RimM [unclassified Mesorhizobium]BCH22243.1 ribosome maturation factor RimM [Mesorhizobium sp. L-8-3]BCH30057.1 ribosome maturation factor RimM [Mesorhizobium sp. L-8-10]
MPKPQNPVQMAVIGAAHGIRGELRVKTFTGDPLALGDYGPLYAKDGRAFEVVDIRPQGTVAVVRFKGVGDRNSAEALNGVALFVDRSALPDDLQDDEFYHADLVGLLVRDGVGAGIGKVRAVQNFGGGDILEVVLDTGGDVLVPFTAAAVPEVSVAGGYVVVDPVAAGLVENEEGPDDDDGFDPTRRPRGPREAGGNR